jgi:hypothetical protein
MLTAPQMGRKDNDMPKVEKNTLTPTEEIILNFIDNHVGCQTPDIIRELKIFPKEATLCVNHLIRKGKIKSIEKEHYKTKKQVLCLIRSPAYSPARQG